MHISAPSPISLSVASLSSPSDAVTAFADASCLALIMNGHAVNLCFGSPHT
ncbi:hypothetical protein PR002_g429 [Phytophthora rubi]|uniref:Uncharacterized protein n=1 Tax=Phytophthora rubi TaxID=129364 RepID=A0A6A3P6N8_9STRA|nr:hypothetical protein PR002_g429 [Phytophthora rubi]